jgi:hypothetical protein
MKFVVDTMDADEYYYAQDVEMDMDEDMYDCDPWVLEMDALANAFACKANVCDEPEEEEEEDEMDRDLFY